MQTLSQLSRHLENERQRLQLDYQELADKTGLTPLSVRSVLQGKTAPRITTLMALAESLGLEVLLVPKALASGLQAQVEAPAPAALSRVDRIVADTAARAESTKTDDGHTP